MPDTPDLREQLAAYLAGDLDVSASEALEARMASEPWVADEADRMADLLMDLGRVDAVTPPEGFSARLHEHLNAGIGRDVFAGDPAAQSRTPDLAAAGAAAADGWAAPRSGSGRSGGGTGDGEGSDPRQPGGGGTGDVVSLDARRDRVRRWAVGLSAAASVAVLAIAGLSVLTTSGDDSADTVAMDDAGEDESAARSSADDSGGDSAANTTAAEPVEEAQLAEDGALAEGGALEAPAAATADADEADLADTGVESDQGAQMDQAEQAGQVDQSDQGAVESGAQDESADSGGGAADGSSAADSGPAQDPGSDDAVSDESAAADQPEPAPAPDEPAADEPAAEDQGAGPQVADFGESDTDEAVARATALPAVQRARDADGDPAGTARAYRDEILRSPAFSDGTEPGACLVEVLGGEDEVVPAVAARHVSDGTVLLTYVLVDPDSDEARAWTVDAASCDVLAVTAG